MNERTGLCGSSTLVTKRSGDSRGNLNAGKTTSCPGVAGLGWLAFSYRTLHWLTYIKTLQNNMHTYIRSICMQIKLVKCTPTCGWEVAQPTTSVDGLWAGHVRTPPRAAAFSWRQHTMLATSMYLCDNSKTKRCYWAQVAANLVDSDQRIRETSIRANNRSIPMTISLAISDVMYLWL